MQENVRLGQAEVGATGFGMKPAQKRTGLKTGHYKERIL
jgi:hypothetical protein